MESWAPICRAANELVTPSSSEKENQTISSFPSTELRAFHAFLGEKRNNGSADLLPEEVLEVWRQLHPEPEDFEDDVAVIQAALGDVANGDEGMPLEDFDRQMRGQFNLPAHPEP